MTWAEVRADAIRKFGGELPHAETEQQVIDAFEAFPSAVLRLIDEVADAYALGKVRSCWAVLRSRLANITAARDVDVDVGSERERKVAAAEAWLVNAGCHYDRESEVEDELFGDVGRLRAWRGDELLRRRLLDRWQTVKGRGATVERERDERAAAYVESRARVAQRLAEVKARRDAAAEEDVKRKLIERQEAKAL